MNRISGHQADEGEESPGDVLSFEELYARADLFRSYQKKLYEIRATDQWEMRWGNAERTRFVDSLLKKKPIPSVHFLESARGNILQIVEGLQRVDTIRQLFEDESWRLAALDDIDIRLSGKTVGEIKKANPALLAKIKDFVFSDSEAAHDFSNLDDVEKIFSIFRHLNTADFHFTNQEIRSMVFSGPFSDFLESCNKNAQWRELFWSMMGEPGRENGSRSLEMLLRFFAFHERTAEYQPSLWRFLNEYMLDKRFADQSSIEKLGDLFEGTVELALHTLLPADSSRIRHEVEFEAVLHGLAKNLDFLEDVPQRTRYTRIRKWYRDLQKQEAFSSEALAEDLYERQKVLDRLYWAEAIFAGDTRSWKFD